MPNISSTSTTADKTPQSNMKYPTIKECVKHISQMVDPKYFDENKIKKTAEREIKSAYADLHKVQDDISINEDRKQAWDLIERQVESLDNSLQNLRSLPLKEDIERNAFEKRIWDNPNQAAGHIAVVPRTGAPIDTHIIEVKQIATNHQLLSRPFESSIIPVVRQGHDHPGRFTAGTFKIAILNYARGTKVFPSQDESVTNPKLKNAFKPGSFFLTTNKHNIKVTVSAGNSLKDLKEQINNYQIGIEAKIKEESAGGYRLVLKSKHVGPEHQYYITDPDQVLSDQLRTDSYDNLLPEFAEVPLTEGQTLTDIVSQINRVSKATRVHAEVFRQQGDSYRLYLAAEYSGQGNFINILDQSSVFNQIFAAEYESANLITSRPAFEDLNAPITYASHLSANAFTAGTIHVNNAPILLEEGDSLNQIIQKINGLTPQTGVTATAAKKSNGKFALELTGSTPIKLLDSNRSLNDLLAPEQGSSHSPTMVSEPTLARPLDSLCKISNIPIVRPTNDISDFFRGDLNVKLLSPTTVPIPIQIVPDIGGIREKIALFADKYNELLKTTTKQKADIFENKEPGILQHDQVFQNLQNALKLSLKEKHDLKKFGITTTTQEAFTNEKGEKEPQYENLLSVDKQLLAEALYKNFEEVQKAFILSLESPSSSFLRPTVWESRILGFDGLEVDSTTFDVDFDRARLKSTTSKPVSDPSAPYISKTGFIMLNKKVINFTANDSLEKIKDRVNQAFLDYQNRNSPRELQAQIEQNNQGKWNLTLSLNNKQSIELIDYDDILGDLFDAQPTSIVSAPFRDAQDLAVNQAGSSDPNLLTPGTFKINGISVEVKDTETWGSFASKLNSTPNIGIKAQISSSGSSCVLNLTPLNLLEDPILEDPDNIIKNALVVQHIESQKFYDTTHVAKVTLHTRSRDLAKKALFKVDYSAPIEEQYATIEVFNEPGDKENISLSISYFSQKKERKETAKVMISQGIADRMAVSLKAYSPEIYLDNPIVRRKDKVATELAQLKNKLGKLEKECDAQCLRLTGRIRALEEQHKVNKAVSDALKPRFDQKEL